MIGRDVLMAMLPEHLLLLGIVLLIVLEIAGLAQRASLTVALAAVAAAVWAAARLSFDGYAAAPLPGTSRSMRPRCWPRRWCWRWRCRCC